MAKCCGNIAESGQHYTRHHCDLWYTDCGCVALDSAEVRSMILAFLATRLGRGLIVVSALVLALIVNNSHQRSIGAEKLVAKIEKATNEKISKATAARRSVDSVPDGGLLDSYRRD